MASFSFSDVLSGVLYYIIRNLLYNILRDTLKYKSADKDQYDLWRTRMADNQSITQGVLA
jgi:hypothetical protein